LAEITSAQLLGEAYFGVSWQFFMVEDLQLGFGLIILGEVENLQFYLFRAKDYDIACLNPRRET
jgi:hypothetical protein